MLQAHHGGSQHLANSQVVASECQHTSADSVHTTHPPAARSHQLHSSCLQEESFSQMSAYMGGGSQHPQHPSTPHPHASRPLSQLSQPTGWHASPHLQLTQPGGYGSFSLGSQEYATGSGSQGAVARYPVRLLPRPSRLQCVVLRGAYSLQPYGMRPLAAGLLHQPVSPPLTRAQNAPPPPAPPRAAPASAEDLHLVACPACGGSGAGGDTYTPFPLCPLCLAPPASSGSCVRANRTTQSGSSGTGG